jgi:hypothetical protein
MEQMGLDYMSESGNSVSRELNSLDRRSFENQVDVE